MSPFRIRCREAHWLLSRARDRPLPWAERLALWLHLRVCEGCRRVERGLALLSRAVRALER